MENYVGLDLSMENTQVCIVVDNGRKLASEKVDSSPAAIADMLERQAPLARAVIETGRMSPAICHGLRELAVPLVCIDARHAHQSVKAMKATRPIRMMRRGSRSWREPASTRRRMSNRQRRMECVA